MGNLDRRLLRNLSSEVSRTQMDGLDKTEKGRLSQDIRDAGQTFNGYIQREMPGLVQRIKDNKNKYDETAGINQ